MADKASSQQTADALFLFDALRHVASPVVINASEIAAQKSAKVNTVQKRFSVLKQRYPDLNIQTTTTAAATTPSPARPGKPAKVTKTPAPKKTAAAATTTAKKKKANAAMVAAIAAQLEDESDEGGAKMVAVKIEDGGDEEVNADESGDAMNAEEESDRV